MSFAGSWSTGATAPAPSSGGGGWSTDPSISGGGWLTPAPTAQTVYTTSTPTSYPANYNYQSGGGVYALPGAGMQVGPFGEGGAYTPLDFPLLHELRPGERLGDLQSGVINRSMLPCVALGIIALLLLKKKR